MTGIKHKKHLEMKKNIKRFSVITIIGLFLLIFNGCDDESELFTISENPTAPVLANLGFTDLTLDPINTNNPAINLNWDVADYGQQSAINYAIQFSSDAEFTLPTTAATTTGETALTLSVSEVNSAAGSAGLNPFEWKPVFIRIVSSLGTRMGETSASNAIQVNVYPYLIILLMIFI
jgi:hypothetical protein